MESDPNREVIDCCPRCGDPRGECTYSHDTPGMGPQYHNADHTELVCAVQRVARAIEKLDQTIQWNADNR